MGAVGHEHPPETLTNEHISEQGGADSGALPANNASANILALAAQLAALPADTRAALAALLKGNA